MGLGGEHGHSTVIHPVLTRPGLWLAVRYSQASSLGKAVLCFAGHQVHQMDDQGMSCCPRTAPHPPRQVPHFVTEGTEGLVHCSVLNQGGT